MILRRLTEHVKAQNWFAVAIDFVIVVVGVFIGIQLGNLNEARVERETGRSYLALVANELSNQAESYEWTVRNAEVRMAEIRYVLDVTADPEKARENPSRLATALYFSRFHSYRPPPTNVYEGLESSGNVSLIEHNDLLARIRDHYGEVELWDEIVVGTIGAWHNYNNAVAGYLTADQMKTILDAGLSNRAPLSSFTADDAVALARRLAEDSQVRKWLPAVHDYHYGAAKLSRGLAQEVRTLLADVQAALGDGQDPKELPDAT